MIPDLYKYAGGESLDDKKKREAEERGVESAKKAFTAKPKTEKTSQAKPGKPKPPAKPEFDTSVFEAKKSAGSLFDQPLNFNQAWGVKPPSGSAAAQTMRGDADRANMLFGAGTPSQVPDQPDDPFGQSFTRTSDSLFEQIGIKPQSFTQIRQKQPGTLEHAMAVYDMLEYGRPTFGYKTGDKEADRKRNQFMSSILTGSNIRLNESKNPESFDGVYLPTLTTSLYAKAKEKLGEDGAMEFLANTGLIPRGQIIDTSEWGDEAKSDARMMLSGAVPGVDPRTGKKAFYNAPESAKEKGLSPMGFVGSFPKESEYGALPLATLQQSEAKIPKFTPGDLGDAGVTGAQKAILKDDPFFGEHDSTYRTYVDAVQGVVNPFTTVTQLSGQATSDLPTPARLGVLAGDFVFQLALGELAGGEMLGAAKAGRTAEFAAKWFTVDNLMDLPDYLQAVDNDGFQKGTAEFVVGLANQFNPGVLLDPNTSPDEKMITFLSLATMGAGSAYSKIKNSQYAKRAMSVPSLDEIVSRGGLDALPAAVRSEATKFADQMYVLSGGVPGSKSGPDLILRDLADQAATVHAAQLYHIYQSPKMVGEALESMLPSPEDAITSKAMAIAALDMAQQRADAKAKGADFEAMKGWPKIGDPGQVEAQSQEVVSIANEATQAILTGNEESVSPPAERVVKEIKQIYSGVDLVDNWDFKPDAKPIKPGESSRDAGAMFDHEKPGTALVADLRNMYEDDFDGLPDIADIEREFDLVDVTTNKTTGEKSLFIRDKSGLITNVGPLDGNIDWNQAYKNHIETRAKEVAKAKITDAKQYVDAVSGIPFLADSSIMRPEQSKAQFMAIVDDAVQKITKSGWTVDEAMGHIGEEFHHYFDDLDFEIEPEKMFPGLKGAVEELAGLKKDKSHVDSNGREWKHIGTNAYGNDLFEDPNGVRKVLRDGVYVAEKVRLRPTREGMKTEVDRKDGAPLDNDFRTVEEGELIDEPSAPAPSAESKPEPAPKVDPKPTDVLGGFEGKSGRDEFLAEMEKLKNDIDAGKIDESQFADPEPSPKASEPSAPPSEKGKEQEEFKPFGNKNALAVETDSLPLKKEYFEKDGKNVYQADLEKQILEGLPVVVDLFDPMAEVAGLTALRWGAPIVFRNMPQALAEQYRSGTQKVNIFKSWNLWRYEADFKTDAIESVSDIKLGSVELASAVLDGAYTSIHDELADPKNFDRFVAEPKSEQLSMVRKAIVSRAMWLKKLDAAIKAGDEAGVNRWLHPSNKNAVAYFESVTGYPVVGKNVGQLRSAVKEWAESLGGKPSQAPTQTPAANTPEPKPASVVITEETKALGLTQSAAEKKLAELEQRLAEIQSRPNKKRSKQSGSLDPDVFEEAWVRAGIAVVKIGVKIETAVHGALRSLGVGPEHYADVKNEVVRFLTGDTESPEQSGQDGNTIGSESDGRTDQRDQASSSQTGEQKPSGDQGLPNPDVREEGSNGEAGGSGRTSGGRRPKPNGVADGEQDGAGDGQERGDHGDAPVSGRPEPGGRGSGDAGRRNFRYGSPDEVLRQQSLGVAERRDVAIDAITALREANRNGFATPEQQAAMAAFPGWGLIKTYIHKDNKSAGAKRLKAMLTPEDYIAAANATINAHYTSPQAIGAMWEAVRNLGFTGGSVLEPSAGSGLFYSLMPEDLHASSTMNLVELDQTTAGMLKFIFPESDVQAKGYEKTRLTPDKYDLVISNVPFARTKIMDAALLRLMGPEAFSHIEMSVHNFFIAKSVVQTKPGGLVAVITTAGTMDAPSSEGFRSWLAENADLLGAIRLPNNAFDASAKTEVVTDILFLRKKGNPALPESKAKFAKSTVRDIGGHPQYVNEYFQKNPQNILGVESSRGTMYGPNSYTVEGNPESDLADELPKAIRSAIGKQKIAPIDAVAPTQTYRFADESRRVNEIYKNGDGQIVQKTIDGVEEPLEFPNTKAGKDSKFLWTDYLALKSAVEDVLSKQEAGTDEELVASQKAAIEIHRKFVAKHGNLYENKTTESRRELTAKAIDKLRESGDLETAVQYGEIDEEGGKYFRTIETIRWKNTPTLSKDSLWAKVYSIEKFDYDSKSVVGYGQPFTKRVSTSQIEMKADSPQDAVQLSYNIKGKFDLEFISEMLGIDGDAAVKALGDAVFKTPEGEYVDSTEYLSGNVRLKLNQAKAAFESGDQSMARNIKALEDAQPPRKEFADISFRMGSAFVPVDVYKKFFDAAGINLDLNKSAFGFKVSLNYANQAAQSRFAPGQVDLDKVLRAAMEQRGVGPQYVTVGEDKVRSMELEEEMNAAVENLVGSFMEYIKIDSESQKAIADAFNEEVNVWQKSVIDGSGLRFPGLSNHVEIRPHSTSAIARAMRNRATYWWHGVGSGKTYTGVMLSLKMKQTGLRNKPMFVAYKPTLTQVAEHYYSAYPNANILVAADDSFSPQKREMFLAQIAAGDWDAVVVTQEQFNTVKLSAQATKDYYMALMRQTLEDYEVDGLDYGDSIGQMSDRQIQDAVKKTGEDRQTQRQMVNEIKRIQDAMDKAVANLQGYDIVLRKIKDENGRTETVRDIVPLEKAVSGIDWSMLGVDHVILDEAHMYKGLPIATKKQIAHSSSQRAEGFNMIAQSLATTGGGLTMMSGTALVNSFAETYVILKYLMPDTLAKMGLGHFDTWASTYTKIEAKPEVTVDGKVKIKDRVTEFNNIDELASLLEQVVDIVPTSSIPEIVLPDTEDEHGTKTTKPIVVEVEPTETQKTLFQEIGRRFLVAKDQAKLPPSERTEFVLALSTLSRQLSQDARLVASKFSPEFQAMASSDQPRKIEAMIDRSVELYKKHYSDIGTQILFVEWGIPGGASDINLYADLKRRLVAAGVKPEEIKLISDVKTNRDRKIVNEGMNSGKIRFLIGSRPKLGVGMNVQKHLKAVHHMDIGWNPANIEQGNGRIIRFGNKWKQVQIYYYVTKGTFDQVTGQKTLQKGNIISQLMNALSGRLTGLKTLEAEPGEDMVGFGEILASSMGDRRIIDLINAGAQLKKASLQSRQFESGKMIAESRIPAIESGELPRAKRMAEMSQKVAEAYDPTAPVKPAAFSDIKGETPLEMFEDAASRTFEAAKNSRNLSLSLMFGNEFKIQFASSYHPAAWEGARSGYRVLVTVSDSNGTVLDSGDVWTEDIIGKAIPYNESQIIWAQVGLVTKAYNAGRFSGRALASFVESYKTPQVQALHYANRLATLQKELDLFKAELSKPNPHVGVSAELEKTVTRLEFETGFSLSSINDPRSDGESMFGARPTTVSPASGTVQIDIPDPETGRPSGQTRSAKILERNSKGWLWVEFDDGTLGHLANYGNPDSNQESSTPEIQDGADSHIGSDYQISQADWEGLTADEVSKVAKSLEVVARGAGIPTQIEGIGKSAKGVLGLYASGTVKFPKGRIRTARGLRETILAGVLAHEIGHSIDAAVSQKAKGGRVKTTGDLKLLLPGVDPDVAKAELIEVTKHLVGKAEFARDSTYYKSNKELFARLIEGMLRAPSATERLAPESSRAVGNYILENPFVRDTFLAASGSLKNNQSFVVAPDARQHYIKALGPYLGEKAYTNEIVYQKNRLKQIEYAAQLIKEKSKGVKDRPEDLFNAAEGIFSNINGEVRFGTRDYKYLDPSKESYPFDAGYLDDEGWWPEEETVDGKERWAKWRWTEVEARANFEKLSPEGKALILEFTADAGEAKDVFNREMLRLESGIQSSIEGWVHHFHEESPFNPRGGTRRLKKMVAGARRNRSGADGYSTDFWKASQKAITDLLVEAEQNRFVADQSAAMMEFVPPDGEIKNGYTAVAGNIVQGFFNDGDVKILVPDRTGKLSAIKPGATYQIPTVLWERHLKARAEIKEVSLAMKALTNVAQYWTVNTLIHPATWATNFISGGIQFALKMQADFILDTLNYQGRRNRTVANTRAILATLTPKGWDAAPGYMYGDYHTMAVSTYMGFDEPGLGRKVSNIALWPMQKVEEYWKKVVVNAEQFANTSKTGDKKWHTDPESKEFYEVLARQLDLYTLNYDNVPPWMEAWTRNPVGTLVKPYSKYAYKYMKTVASHLGAAFDPNLDWQTRVARSLSLGIMIMAFYALRQKQSEETDTDLDVNPVPEDVDLDKLSKVVDTRGRLFVGKNDRGNDVYMRTAKYPFMNITDTLWSLAHGNPGGAVDVFRDFAGGLGPGGTGILDVLGFNSEYDKYTPADVRWAGTATSFIPAHRLVKDTANILDPVNRKPPKTWQQEFGMYWPTTDAEWLNKYRPEERTYRIPFTESELARIKTSRQAQREGWATPSQLELLKRSNQGTRETYDDAAPKDKLGLRLRLGLGLTTNEVNPDWQKRFIERLGHNAKLAKEKEAKAKR